MMSVKALQPHIQAALNAAAQTAKRDPSITAQDFVRMAYETFVGSPADEEKILRDQLADLRAKGQIGLA